MIAYYAIGGGLGHLTRAQRMLDHLGLDATIVTASPHAHLVRDFRVIEVPSHLERDVNAHRAWMRALDVSRWIVDTFPGGIQGELCGLDTPMDYVARLLRWDEYRRVVPFALPAFETVYVVEELTPDHDAWVEGLGVRRLCCRFPIPERRQAAALLNFWLIVHSGPADEVLELVAYANELRNDERVLVATQCDVDLPPGFEKIDAYPVAHLYPSAARIISAAGFNVMLETEPYRDKHHVVPFPRRFDDQFLRAARRRERDHAVASESRLRSASLSR